MWAINRCGQILKLFQNTCLQDNYWWLSHTWERPSVFSLSNQCSTTLYIYNKNVSKETIS